VRDNRSAARTALITVVAASCTAVLAALGVAAPAAGSVAQAGQITPPPGTQLWASQYDGSANADTATAVAVSPSGKAVFVTGRSAGKNGIYDYATVAYDAATGNQLWASRYHGFGGVNDAYSLAVSPDGNTIFVTGFGQRPGFCAVSPPCLDYATVAYRAATGARLWVSRYNSPGNGDNIATSVKVSPDGGTVYVTGSSNGTTSGADYATIAYNAATGAQRWVSRYDGPGNRDDLAYSLAVSPFGHTVFVTGASRGTTSGTDYATVAYRAATGAKLWVRRYNGPGNGPDIARSLVVSPAGRTVFVTGASVGGPSSGSDYATVAYNAATGARRWVSRFSRPFTDAARSIAVSPTGHAVFVTGYTTRALPGTSATDFATVAYNAASGAQLWAKRYSDGLECDGVGTSVTAGPGGGMVFVTGFNNVSSCGPGNTTIGYRAGTGAQVWVSHINRGVGVAYSAAVSPTGETLFVTGGAFPVDRGALDILDYVTVAYRT
jgi:WD40 repeat protein